jgi:hypothetical protein
MAIFEEEKNNQTRLPKNKRLFIFLITKTEFYRQNSVKMVVFRPIRVKISIKPNNNFFKKMGVTKVVKKGKERKGNR